MAFRCASGADNSLILDYYSGSICVFGNKANCSPTKIINLPPIHSISTGEDFSFFLEINGDVWRCGEICNKIKPEKIPNLSNITSVIGVGCSSFFLDKKGSVWACGNNQNGQLGLGDTINRSKPEKIEGLPKIKSIAGGLIHSLFLDREGSVWACGNNQNGQLGLDDANPVDTIITKAPQNRSKPEKIEGLPKITQIAGGNKFSMFVDETGHVWACGSNYYGELGLGHNENISQLVKIESLSEIIAVAGGCYSSMFLNKQGDLFTCGKNQYGQLGHGDKETRNIAKKVEGVPEIAALSNCNSSFYYFQFVDIEGRVWACGRNEYGQLGVGDKIDRDTPVQVGIRVGPARGGRTKSARKVL